LVVATISGDLWAAAARIDAPTVMGLIPFSKRWAAPAAVVAVTIAGLFAILVLPTVLGPWYRQHVPRRIERETIDVFLRVARAGYLAVTPALPVIAVVAWCRMRGLRRRRQSGVWSPRLLLLSGSLLFFVPIVEGLAAWRLRALDGLSVWGAVSNNDDDEAIDLVVIGESSALGWPYSPHFSVGQAIAWQLEQVFRDRPVRLHMRAVSGCRLEQAMKRLSDRLPRPDAILVYSGHNEFQSRFAWTRTPPYYADDPGITLTNALAGIRRVSAVLRMIDRTSDANRVDEPPGDEMPRELVDRPCCSADERLAIRDEYDRQLEAVVRYGKQVGAVVLVIVPPGNLGGFAPNRSYLAENTALADRRAFTAAFLAAREQETISTDAAEAEYRRLLAEQPGFAEGHFRLAHLLEARGKLEEAESHYQQARDFDGLPIRAPADLLDVARSVAQRNSQVVLVDGPEVLRRISPRRIVGDDLMHDAQHPTYRAHLALAQDSLDQLACRRAFGWPAGRQAPVLDPVGCAAHFGIDVGCWEAVCRGSAYAWSLAASVRYDPESALSRAELYEAAERRIAAGELPESVGVPGLGVVPAGLTQR
jgi:tetratricopeptide (TPR) repeat protein